jgi:hypothetical protein
LPEKNNFKKVKVYQILVKNDPYFSGYTRVSFALVAAAILVWLSAKLPISELVYHKRFYFSMVFGFVLAIIIIEVVHWSNVCLDRCCDWQVRRNKRLVLQLVFGVVAVLYLDVWLVKGVYHMLEENFDKGKFMEQIFPINIGLVLFLNVLFFFRKYDSRLFDYQHWYRQLFREREDTDLSFAEVIPIAQSTELIRSKIAGRNEILLNPAESNPTTTSAIPQQSEEYWLVVNGYIQSTKYTFGIDEVLYIKTGAVYGDIYLKNNRVCNMHYRGKTLRAKLNPNHFVEIQAGIFYALDIIEGKRIEGKNHFLVVRAMYADMVVHTAISRRFLSNFDQVFKAYKKRSIKPE